MNLKLQIAKQIATVFCIGKIKYAPGTLGSLVAFPLCYIIMYFVLNQQMLFEFSGFNREEQQIMSLFIILLLATLVLFFVGTYFTSIYIKDMKDKDPSEVVIDEVVGQMLTNILSSGVFVFVYNSSIPNYLTNLSMDIIFLFLLPFAFFRLFDIRKPWPINWLDQNVKGALGVMIDDIAAAIFAVTVYYALIFVVVDFFPKV